LVDGYPPRSNLFLPSARDARSGWEGKFRDETPTAELPVDRDVTEQQANKALSQYFGKSRAIGDWRKSSRIDVTVYRQYRDLP
jgi:hypothetical protein